MEEDDSKTETTYEMKSYTVETLGSAKPTDSSKISSNELSPDRIQEIENPFTKTENDDSFITSNKLNGDCSIECSVSSPSVSSNNNITSTCKISSESSNIPCNEKLLNEIDECTSNESKKKDKSTSETEIPCIVVKERETSKNLINSSQQKNDFPLISEERKYENECTSSNKSSKPSNQNDMTLSFEEKNTCETKTLNTGSVKIESRSTLTKTKRFSSDSSFTASSKINEPFKPPARHDSKSNSKAKLNENVSECILKQNDGGNKVADKSSRNNKRKTEDKHINNAEGELGEIEKFPIQYKGFKKKTHSERNYKRLNLKSNPFNPACKPHNRSNKCFPSRLPIGDEIDCSSLQQSEYAQYLGLQPILKFRCSNCGSSSFQSLVALNTHQLECTKSGKGKLDKVPPNLAHPVNEPKSTNIKLTRKVFLCSACGTYYEHWNLFLHMREVHRRYICLYCLGMFSVAEKLSEHLIQKHKITHQNFNNLEDFQKHSYQTFFLLCLTCDKVFSEMDDFCGHVCTANKKNLEGAESSNKSETIQEPSIPQTSELFSNIANNKTAKRTREINKKNAVSTRASQLKKDEAWNGNVVQRPEESGIIDCKDEVCKQSDLNVVKPLEVVDNSVNENPLPEHNFTLQNDSDTKSVIMQETKLQESQGGTENLLLDKPKSVKKSKAIPKKSSVKRKKTKEKEEDNEATLSKVGKVVDDEPSKECNTKNLEDSSLIPPSTSENNPEIKDELINAQIPESTSVQETNAAIIEEHKEETADIQDINKVEDITKEEIQDNSKEDLSITPMDSSNSIETKNKLQANLLKFKLPGIESDGESDDSQKLLVVDENANSDAERKPSTKSEENSLINDIVLEAQTNEQPNKVSATDNNHTLLEGTVQDITLASEDVTVMALTLEDKIENIPIQTILKECVRTSCMSCNYCRHAVKIAVNGKQLALHILSEHRYMPIKNETPDDVINKLKTSLTSLETIFFNTETYDSSDTSIHVPYDQDSSFDCFQCNYVTSSHRDLFAHKRKSHTKSLLLCIMCKTNFYSYSELLCHLCPGTYNAEIQFHNVDINFRCCFCRLDTIPSAFRLMVHLRKTHHTCDICLENGVDQQKLSTHMWKHKLNHLCYRCGIAYASKPDITKHLFWKHGHESVLCKKCLQKKWPHVYHFCIPPTSFICEECNTSFSKAVALKVHKRIHGNDYPYLCTECNKKFISKKLLQRHEERHNAIKNNAIENPCDVNQEEEQKEEIINVLDVNENKESSSAAEVSESKELEPKDKVHKKHKKDKDKKDKQVMDVYDLPPLNLSSESDSSDEDNTNDNCNTSTVDKNAETLSSEEFKKEKNIIQENKDHHESSETILELNEFPSHNITTDLESTDKVPSPKLPLNFEDTSTSTNKEDKHQEEKNDNNQNSNENGISTDALQEDKVVAINALNITEKTNLESCSQIESSDSNKEVEDIWKNFYNTNPQNSNLPYPLCAIKSEIALGIIMGDHDYCHQRIESPMFRDDIPSTSGLSAPLISDNLEEIIEQPSEKVNDDAVSKDITAHSASPVTSPKKKPKSPKKPKSKGENENNTSSSSDSSSESSSSSCSCGPNCSCSSSSSNSSSSSSSDSESSAGEEGTKQERKRKKRERRNKTKSDQEPELPKEQLQSQPEKTIPAEPVDPPIRESELETDESTTDEEFYDQQPQRIANQLLAEKRNQLMLLASAANVNNGNASPSPLVDVMQPEIVNTPKQKVKTKRKRKITTKGKAGAEKNISNSHSYPQYTKDNDPGVKPVIQYHNNPLPPVEPKLLPFVTQTPVAETTGSGSETEKSRSSKRRRIPNKFYGYSSGEEDDKPTPSPKWRKQDIVNQPSRVQPTHPATPRIQLTVPKQVIRKPYKFQKSATKVQPSSSDSTDSGSEMENQRAPQIPVVSQDTSTSATSQKNDKDVYCYCRCPYDEVSEMIACDDENCEIEWFHFECVGILVPPRGQWFCPGCRKARGLPT